MAWQDEPSVIFRDIVGDYDGTIYSAARVRRLLAIAAYRVRSEVSFDTTYEVDLTANAESVTPDPETRSPKDYDFINLIALKAAIMLLAGEHKIAAGDAVTIKDGPSTITMGDKAKYLQARLEWAKQEYIDYIKAYISGDSKYAGAVTGPMTTERISGGWSINGVVTSRNGEC
jgi:hypothetical protein